MNKKKIKNLMIKLIIVANLLKEFFLNINAIITFKL